MEIFANIINQALNQSPYSVLMLGNLILMGDNKANFFLVPLRALRTVFTRKSDVTCGLPGN